MSDLGEDGSAGRAQGTEGSPPIGLQERQSHAFHAGSRVQAGLDCKASHILASHPLRAMVQTSLFHHLFCPKPCPPSCPSSVHYIPNGCISDTRKRSCTSRIVSDSLSSHHAVINKMSWLRLEQRKLAVGLSEVTTRGRSGGGAVGWVGGDPPVLGQCWSNTRRASRWRCTSIHSQSHES